MDGQVDEHGEEVIWLNCVGTFGISSAAYWWSRAAACVVRLGHLLATADLDFWHLIFADDGELIAAPGGAHFRILFQLLLFCVLGVPVAWSKVRARLEQDFVGYRLDVAKFRVGLSERRAVWAADWARATTARGFIKPEEMTVALGRLGFAAGPLDWLRPYLGPLYAWAAACPSGRFLLLPAMLRLILSWLARMIDGAPPALLPCPVPARSRGALPGGRQGGEEHSPHRRLESGEWLKP